MFKTVENLQQSLEKEGYIAEPEITVPLFLALKLGKPILIEGPPGVGKTEVAKVLGSILQTNLIRLQCYEGLDENKALYEWNYQKQLLRIQMTKDCPLEAMEETLFSDQYLLERPLLKAIRAEESPVLLIDEIDKTDEEFEAFLFEVLSDFQVSVPELGTLKARQIPVVVLTSNAQRELSDGLKRRCVYLYIDFPAPDKELKIINARVPEAGPALAGQVAKAVNYIRTHLDLRKKPSIAETLDWARAIVALDADRLSAPVVDKTLNMLFKHKEDIDTFRQEMGSEGLVKELK